MLTAKYSIIYMPRTHSFRRTARHAASASTSASSVFTTKKSLVIGSVRRIEHSNEAIRIVRRMDNS